MNFRDFLKEGLNSADTGEKEYRGFKVGKTYEYTGRSGKVIGKGKLLRFQKTQGVTQPVLSDPNQGQIVLDINNLVK